MIFSLAVALGAAIEGSATLGNILAGDKVYNGLAPEGSKFPYITLSNFNEIEKNLFNCPGTFDKGTLTIWTRGSGEMDVLTIYEDLRTLLHNKRLVLGAGKQIQGKLRLILTGAGDQSDSLIVRGVVEYSMRAVA